MNSITFDLTKTYTGGRKLVDLFSNGSGSHPYGIELPDEPVDRVTITAGENSIGIYLKKFLSRLVETPGGGNGTQNGAPDVRRVMDVYSGQIEIPPYIRESGNGFVLDEVRKILENSLNC